MKMERACGSCERGAGLCRLHKEQLQKDAAARPPAMKRRQQATLIDCVSRFSSSRNRLQWLSKRLLR